MKHTTSTAASPGANRLTRVVATLLAIVVLPATSHAAPEFLFPDEYRVLGAAGKFEDTYQFAASYRLRAPRPLRAHHLELAVGTIYTSSETRPFLSLGPVWRFAATSDGRTFVDFGFSPTVLSGTRFNGRDIGGNFHFTSSLALGTRFGRTDRYSLSLRAQHTSNGGLDSENPGLDMIGLTFAIEFRE